MVGVVKARQLSSCEIVDCSYDFEVSDNVDLISPFYVNKTKSARKLNETLLSLTTQDNNVIITLTDVNSTKPIADVEIAIINNDMVYSYEITDDNGQVILNDLVGTFNFEFLYPGDDVAGYVPSSINKTFTFTKSQNTNQSTSSGSTNAVNVPAKTVKKVSKIIAKKATFKKSKKVKKYTIILKSGKSPIKKVKVFLKVKGKTCKAKITFKGNINYNACGKTIKIKVK